MASAPNNNSNISNLLSKSKLTKNVLWNFVGRILPMGIAFFTIPMIIKGIGNERFGLLTLIWMVFGYASIFDLGLGRALTLLIAESLGKDATKNIKDIIWTTLFLVFILGSVGAILLYVFSAQITTNILNVSSDYVKETTSALKLISYCLPAFFLACSLSGVLEAYQKFGIANVIRFPLALFNYILPVLILPFTQRLDAIVLALLVGRVLMLFANFFVCATFIDDFLVNIKIKKEYIKSLISFGGWSTISNIINPVMVTFDRIFIANLLSASVVAFYTTPFEVISKLYVVQGCITTVMFPAFTTEIASRGENRLNLYHKTLKVMFLILIIPVSLIILGAKIGLSLWISPEFAQSSYQVAQILALGFLVSCMAGVPFSMIQAYGKSNITAVIHLIELPIYLVLMLFLILHFGIVGAALAWLIRATLDFVILYFSAIAVDKKYC